MSRLVIATPVAAAQTAGNRVTASRYATLLRELGHEVVVVPVVEGEPTSIPDGDLLIALHAVRSAEVLDEWTRRGGRFVLVLTGTDLYQDLAVPESGVRARDRAGDREAALVDARAVSEDRRQRALRSLALAERIVTLQPLAIERLLAPHRERAVAIVQSCPLRPLREPGSATGASRTAVPRIVLAGHLREVKDPFCVVAALALVPDLNVEVVHFGGELEAGLGELAASHARKEARYTWRGERPFGEVSAELASARFALLTSHLEGGANAVIEAIAHDVPVLTSAIDGSLGILGQDYPGVFRPGNAGELARLIARALTEPAFERALMARTRSRREWVQPEREREAWGRLVVEVLGGG